LCGVVAKESASIEGNGRIKEGDRLKYTVINE